ncbi:hypothetical protein [Fluviicola sp.]|uniref:hypothetical protein n=1 Tax=Fluviicola sp. TaxID=1917219 RepID=UPI00261308BE|nr:hypothetical protein [Fluviicola sp.]
MLERTLYISILIGFFILSGAGICFGNPEDVKWADWITEQGTMGAPSGKFVISHTRLVENQSGSLTFSVCQKDI